MTTTPPTLRFGDVGPDVGRAQARLVTAGARLRIDNDYGKATLGAVRAFQRQQGLPDDGVVGPRTWAALDAFAPMPTPKRPDLVALVDKLPEPRRSALLRAIGDVGKAESPRGANRGPEIDHLGPNGQPWCSSAVCAWTGLPRMPKVLCPPDASLEGWAIKHGVLRDAWATGAAFLMGRGGSGSDAAGGSNPGHTGLVVGETGGRLITVDGNVGDAVTVCERRPDTLRGFVWWWLA